MGFLVCHGAGMQCSFGTSPAFLAILPLKRVFSTMPAATIMDNIPLVNLPPFNMCTSMANPTVASATAAAMGVLTPMPCIPVTPSPWMPGSPQVLIGNIPALNNNSKLLCAWGGVIQISVPGQSKTMVP